MRADGRPWHLAAVVFAATSVIVGLVWDISWHMTIGRDTFWTPAHLAIYTGGAVAGLFSGFEVLRRSFFDHSARDDSLTIWGIFHGPLGGWLCIWGAIAMLTSAPFDDWWHDAYGLDVKIISPPHAILALGFITILAGAVLMAVSHQSHAEEGAGPTAEGAGGDRAPWIVAYCHGLVITMLSIFSTEYHDRTLMHAAIFYIVSALIYPCVLVAAARSSRLRWPATAAATIYTLLTCLQLWILPLFEGSPKLGPIRTPVTHMVPMDFPLLLLPTAIAIDLLMRKLSARGPWVQASVIGMAFTAVHVVTQWPFADFLMSEASKNAVFRTDNIPYMMPRDWPKVRGLFLGEPLLVTVRGLGVALIVAALSSRLGLAYGGWLRAVRR